MLCARERQGIFAGVFKNLNIPSAGAWKNRGMCPCFFAGCWMLLVEKLTSQKTLLGVVICANENWVALLFQSWNILVWHLGPRARAVLSRLFLGARARTWSDQTTQRKACGSFSANTNDKRRKTRLLAFVPPPQVYIYIVLIDTYTICRYRKKPHSIKPRPCRCSERPIPREFVELTTLARSKLGGVNSPQIDKHKSTIEFDVWWFDSGFWMAY